MKLLTKNREMRRFLGTASGKEVLKLSKSLGKKLKSKIKGGDFSLIVKDKGYYYDLEPLVHLVYTIIFEPMYTVDSYVETYEKLFNGGIDEDYFKKVIGDENSKGIRDINITDYIDKLMVNVTNTSLPVSLKLGEEFGIHNKDGDFLCNLYKTAVHEVILKEFDFNHFSSDIYLTFDMLRLLENNNTNSLFCSIGMIEVSDEEIAFLTFAKACFIALMKGYNSSLYSNYKSETLCDLVQEICGEEYVTYLKYLRLGADGVSFETKGLQEEMKEKLGLQYKYMLTSSEFVRRMFLSCFLNKYDKKQLKLINAKTVECNAYKSKQNKEFKKLNKSISSLNKSSEEKDSIIRELKNKISRLKNKLDGLDKDKKVQGLELNIVKLSKEFKASNKKLISANEHISVLELKLKDYNNLRSKVVDLERENTELNRMVNFLNDLDTSIGMSIDDMLEELKDKKLVFIGGPIGFDKRLYKVFNDITFIDIHSKGSNFGIPSSADCVLVYDKIVTHAHVSRSLKLAKMTDIPVITIGVTNIDLVIKLLYKKIIKKGV